MFKSLEKINCSFSVVNLNRFNSYFNNNDKKENFESSFERRKRYGKMFDKEQPIYNNKMQTIFDRNKSVSKNKKSEEIIKDQNKPFSVSDINNKKSEVYVSEGSSKHQKTGEFSTKRDEFSSFKQVNLMEVDPFSSTSSNDLVDIGLSKEIKASVMNLTNGNRLTDLQFRAIRSIVLKRNTVVHSETGCGKTLIYLTAILNQIYNDEKPNSIVILPTKELLMQIEYLLTIIFKSPPLFADKIINTIIFDKDKEENLKLLKKALNGNQKSASIILATARNFQGVVVDHLNLFDKFGLVVLDEIDRLIPVLNATNPTEIKRWKVHPPASFVSLAMLGELKERLYVATGATITNDLIEFIHDETVFGSHLVYCKSANFLSEKFSIPSNIQHQLNIFNDEKGFFNHLNNMAKQKNILLFIPNGVSIDKFIDKAQSFDLSSPSEGKIHYSPLHSIWHNKDTLGDFYSVSRAKEKVEHGTVLVSTPSTASGLDFPNNFTYVVCYGFPESLKQYIHICGRIGRQNSSGLSTVAFIKSNSLEQFDNLDSIKSKYEIMISSQLNVKFSTNLYE